MEARGAIAERDKYSELFLRVTQAAGLLMPIVAVIYSIAVMIGVAAPSPIYNFSISIIISTGFLALGIIQYIIKPSTPISLGVFIGLYHLFGMAYLIFVPGFISPIVFSWIVLVVITEIFYGKFAAIVSLVLLSGTCLLLYLLEPVGSTLQSLNYLIYLTIIVVSAAIIVLLRSVQVVEHQDLKRTRVQEQFQRGQLTALVNSLNAAILSTSITGTVRVYNAALLSLLDTNQSLNGKNIDDVLNLYDAGGNPVSLVDLTRDSRKIVDRDDLTHRFSDGESIRINISCAPIRGHFNQKGKQHEGFIFIMRDITQEKSLEEERDEFISVVSHELRTPITITEGSLSNLQLLMERGHDPKTLSAAVKDAHKQVVYLASMVNDLSTLSRAERGVADAPEEVSIRPLLEEIYHHYQSEAAEKKLEFNFDAGHKLGTVLASRLYLEEILQNLVTNAIKYTQRGAVTLSAHRTGHEIKFSVKDSGIGISKSEQKHIFEKFYRSEDYRTRETSGNGLGLYVVHKLANKIGITVQLESRLNHGSTFSFVLQDTPPANKPQNSLDETTAANVHLT